MRLWLPWKSSISSSLVEHLSVADRPRDASGKGGIVRRLGWALDPRSFKVYPVAAPASHEEGKHYLQRFWEKLPETAVKSSCSTALGTGASWSKGWRELPASGNGREVTRLQPLAVNDSSPWFAS